MKKKKTLKKVAVAAKGRKTTKKTKTATKVSAKNRAKVKNSYIMVNTAGSFKYYINEDDYSYDEVNDCENATYPCDEICRCGNIENVLFLNISSDSYNRIYYLLKFKDKNMLSNIKDYILYRYIKNLSPDDFWIGGLWGYYGEELAIEMNVDKFYELSNLIDALNYENDNIKIANDYIQNLPENRQSGDLYETMDPKLVKEIERLGI